MTLSSLISDCIRIPDEPPDSKYRTAIAELRNISDIIITSSTYMPRSAVIQSVFAVLVRNLYITAV